jgi:hypothetical protein
VPAEEADKVIAHLPALVIKFMKNLILDAPTPNFEEEHSYWANYWVK